MDIAALSMAMSQQNLAQSVGVSVMKKVMDQQEVQMETMISQMMPPTPPVSFETHLLDTYA